MKPLMNVHETAIEIGVHVQTVRKWLAKGELTGSNTSAGWRVTPADIEKWLEKHRRTEQQRQPPHEGEQP